MEGLGDAPQDVQAPTRLQSMVLRPVGIQNNVVVEVSVVQVCQRIVPKEIDEDRKGYDQHAERIVQGGLRDFFAFPLFQKIDRQHQNPADVESEGGVFCP